MTNDEERRQIWVYVFKKYINDAWEVEQAIDKANTSLDAYDEKFPKPKPKPKSKEDPWLG
jgi:hypothetical protein